MTLMVRVAFIKNSPMADELRNLKRELRRVRRLNLALMIYVLIITLGILIYVTSH